MHEFPAAKPHLQSLSSEVTRSYQLGSQGMVGLTTQSSLYGLNPPALNQSTVVAGDSLFRNHGKSPNQTVVRIRGRHNQMIETRGSVHMTLDEERRIAEKKKQLR